MDTAHFYVNRDGDGYSVIGAKIKDKVKPGDKMLVQRGDDQFTLTIRDTATLEENFDRIQDDDIFVCSEKLMPYKVSGQRFHDWINIGTPLRLVTPPAIGLAGGTLVDVAEDSTAIGGYPPYTITNEWAKIVFFTAEVGSSIVENLTPLTAQTNGERYVIGYSDTAINPGTRAKQVTSISGRDWTVTETIHDCVVKGANYFGGSFWMVPTDLVRGGKSRVLRSRDGINWIELNVNVSNSMNDDRLFCIGYNKSTDRVVLGGYNAVMLSTLAKLDQLEAGTISVDDAWDEVISDDTGYKNTWSLLRAVVADPNTNEWWMMNINGKTWYSSNDGETWTLRGFTIPSIQSVASEAMTLHIDKKYLYYSDSKQARGAVIDRNTFQLVTDEYYSYATLDDGGMIRVQHGGKVESKGFLDIDWKEVFDEPIEFTDTTGAIVSSARDLYSDWIFASKGTVVVRKSEILGYGTDFDACDTTSVTLVQTITDTADNSVTGVANLATDLGPCS